MANQSTTPTQNKPTYTPCQAEIENGYIKDGIFHRPNFAILRNGDYLELDGIITGYSYQTALEIVKRLQAVSDDEYSLEPCHYIAMTGYDVQMGANHE